MAGDWIPVQTDLRTRREVLIISEKTGRTRHEVMGVLVDLWAWATQECTEEGRVPGATTAILVSAVGPEPVRVLSEDCPGVVPDLSPETFWMAVAGVGWVVIDDDGIGIPNWDRWLSKTAKLRVKDRLRKRESRQSVRKTSSTAWTEHGLERRDGERREGEEEKRCPPPPNKPPRGGTQKPSPDPEEALRRWNDLAEKQGLRRVTRLTDTRQRKLAARLRDYPDLWDQLAKELPQRGTWAREHRFPTFNQVLEPEKLQKLLEGNYRDGTAPTADPGEEQERQRLMLELQKRDGQTAVDGRGDEYYVERGGAGMHGPRGGYRPWSGFKTPELRKLVDSKLVRWSGDGKED